MDKYRNGLIAFIVLSIFLTGCQQFNLSENEYGSSTEAIGTVSHVYEESKQIEVDISLWAVEQDLKDESDDDMAFHLLTFSPETESHFEDGTSVDFEDIHIGQKVKIFQKEDENEFENKIILLEEE